MSTSNSTQTPIYTPPWLDSLPQRPPPAFRAYRQFNALRETLDFGPDEHNEIERDQAYQDRRQQISLCAVKSRLNASKMSYFPTEQMPDKVARLLGEARALDTKEVIESFEFFQRVRHRVSREVVVDLCCGHGLVGMLFALLERRVETVYLLDVKFPASSARIEALLQEEWPWVSPKIKRLKRSVKGAASDLPTGAGVVAVHALWRSHRLGDRGRC